MKAVLISDSGEQITYVDQATIQSSIQKKLRRLGRPPIYGDEIIEKAYEYLALCTDEEDEYHKTRGEKSDTFERVLRVKLPNAGGLAVYLGVRRETLYDWEKKHIAFSNIMSDLRAIQEDRLLQNGLSGDYSPVIAKVILTKHGYTDKTDITSDGKALPTPILQNVQLHNGHEEDSEPTEED